MYQKKPTFLDRQERERLLQSPHLLESAFAYFGVDFPTHRQGDNFRMGCLNSDCPGDESSYGQLSIEAQPPYRIQCFSCQVRGDVFELLLLLKNRRYHQARGDHFQEAVTALRQLSGTQVAPKALPTPTTAVNTAQPPPVNTPLHLDDNDRTRAIVDLHQQGTIDIAEMPPTVSKYFRSRPYLTPEQCAKWAVFYLPSNAKSTLRGRVAYQIDNVRSELLAIAGRDPKFESKAASWRQSQTGKEPVKTRFPSQKFFHRGYELYGQQARRLAEPGYLDAIRQTGLWLVEGFNDVIALDSFQQPALGLMSNRITEAQVEKLVRFRQETKAPGVTLLLDQNDEGKNGTLQLLEKLSPHLPVLNGWPRSLSEVLEPEQLGAVSLPELVANLQQRWQRG